jgi:hypothetical protein
MNKLKFALMAMLAGAFMASCSKDNDAPEGPELPDTAKMTGSNWVPARVKKVSDYVYLDEKYQVVYVVNLPAPDVGKGASEGHRPVGFNFDTRSTILGDNHDGAVDVRYIWASTQNWHVYFDDMYNSSIHSNATTADWVEGEGKVKVVATAFDELKEAPTEAFTRSLIPVSLNESSPILSWGFYRLGTHALYPYKDHTLVFKLRDNRYVKMQLVNLYKDNPGTPPWWEDPKSKTLAPFLNFRYFIQQTPGSRNISTN